MSNRMKIVRSTLPVGDLVEVSGVMVSILKPLCMGMLSLGHFFMSKEVIQLLLKILKQSSV